MSDNELLQFVSQQIVEEGTAEKVFREFDKALLMANETIIRTHIESHKDAHFLWQKAYPEDVAIQLGELSSKQPIKSIPITDDGKRIKIISQGWPFPIEMNFINGVWKVNAEKIIELRISTDG